MMIDKLRMPALLLAFAAGLTFPAAAASQKKAPECTVILDAASGDVVYREGVCDKRLNPFSTFKFPLALIGYDAGILEGEHTPAWDYKPEFDAVKRDRKTVDPTIWEKDSVLWFSREITRRLGHEKFAAYVKKLGYGNMDVSGDAGRNNGLTHSWLKSSLKIAPDEQAQFVRSFLAGKLPVSGKANDMTQAVIPSFASQDGWTVHGKTGSGRLGDDAGKANRNRPLGWFVGWAQKDGRKVVFARMQVGADSADSPKGPKVRDMFLKELPQLMKQR